MTVADAALPLQNVIVVALKSANIAGQRIYHRPPNKPTFPYVSLGPWDVLTEAAAEYEGSDTTLQIDGWSSVSDGGVEIKQIGRAIRAALHEQDFTLTENQRLVSLTVEQVRYQTDPNGETEHAIVTVRARTEPTA